MKPSAIIFDIDGTLYKLKPTGVFKGSYFQREILSNVRKYLDKTGNAHLHGTLSKFVRSGYSLTQFFFQNSLPEADYMACWDINPSGIVEYDENINELLTYIKSENCELFLVSRAPSVWVRNVIRYSNIDADYFTKIFAREDIPSTKDSALKDIKQILHSRGMSAEHAFMVGDEEDADLHPARNLGFRAMKSEGPESIKDLIRGIFY
jgi:FMN phosphatase YigB (HAD superfamily)